jgi:hypothetical protein
MKTIKEKVLIAMSKRSTVARKDLCLIIFKAQGKKVTKSTKYKEGYYGNNINVWVNEGLLIRPKGGGYKIGKVGKQFIKNPANTKLLIRLKKAESSVKSLRDYNESLRIDLATANGKIRDVKYLLFTK